MKKSVKIILILALILIIGGSAALTRVYGLLPAKAESYTVACVGDSLTFGLMSDDPATQSYPAVLSTLKSGKLVFTAENYGCSGATVDHESFKPYTNQAEYTSSLTTTANVVVIMLGTNDAVMSPNQTDFDEDYKQLLDIYINLPQKPKVIVITPPHLYNNFDGNVSKLADREKAIAQEMGLDVIDIYALSADMGQYSKDNVHFNAEGYKLLAEYIYTGLNDILS
jgi:lysophospholipase L1-like esterase